MDFPRFSQLKLCSLPIARADTQSLSNTKSMSGQLVHKVNPNDQADTPVHPVQW